MRANNVSSVGADPRIQAHLSATPSGLAYTSLIADTAAATGLLAIATKDDPSKCAANEVVPLRHNGARTQSPGVARADACRGNSDGNMV